MKWMLLAASALVAAGLWLPGQAAQPTAHPPPDREPARRAGCGRRPDYLRSVPRMAAALYRTPPDPACRAARAADLQPRQRARLEQVKAYYDWLAGLRGDRDRRFRERFDQIDANHDGTIDPAERTAWRDKQRAFYGRGRGAAEPAAVREAR